MRITKRCALRESIVSTRLITNWITWQINCHKWRGYSDWRKAPLLCSHLALRTFSYIFRWLYFNYYKCVISGSFFYITVKLLLHSQYSYLPPCWIIWFDFILFIYLYSLTSSLCQLFLVYICISCFLFLFISTVS